jgi:hypothetical protein
MFKFTDYINVTAFFIAFCIGIFFTYIYSPPKKIIIKWPTPENAGKIIYRDHADTCYKYKADEIPCPDDKSQIKKTSIQYVEDNKNE